MNRSEVASRVEGTAAWLHRLRLRVFAVLVAAVLLVVGVMTFTAWSVVPVVGVTFLTVAAVVHQMTSKLSEPTCSSCGQDLTGQAAGTYGVICPGCGGINENVPGRIERVPGSRRA